MSQSVLLENLIPGTSDAIVEHYLALSERAKTEVFGLDEPEVVILDTETTGFSEHRDHIIQIAAARMKGPEVRERFMTYVHPGCKIPKEIQELTGISDEDVKGAPSIDAALEDLSAFVGNCDIVAHNASFDRRFVLSNAKPGQIPGDWLDTLDLSRIVLPRFKNHTMGTLSTAFGTAASTHNAADDVEALCGVWRVLLVAASDLPAGLAGFIANLKPDTHWPLRKVFAHIAAATPDTRFSLRSSRIDVTAEEKVKNKEDAAGCGMLFPSTSEVREAFGPDSYAGKMYGNYEQREEQVAMAVEVIEAFASDSSRAIEAGTGVGKSMAYLLPAALSAKRNDIGIGVATKTNALMDQLVYYELPQLASVLPDGLRYVALKGYEHYPCLRKLERFAGEEPVGAGEAAAAEVTMVATLYSFVTQTAWGDLDAVNLYWGNLPRERIIAQSADCTHSHCPYYPNKCMLHGLRQRAKSADIVVTNHALLYRDVMSNGDILPPIRHWIIDEAHAAEDEARKQLSPSVSVIDLKNAMYSLHGAHSSVFSSLKRKAKKMDGGGLILALIASAEEQALLVDTLCESFFSFVKDLAPLAEVSDYEYVDLWVNTPVRDTGPWGVVASTGTSLAERLKKLVDYCRQITAAFEPSSAELSDMRMEISSLSGYLQEMYEALCLVIDGTDGSYVYEASLCRNPDKQRESLKASLLDVGDALIENFYPNVISVIYTSATIATGDSFSHFAHAMGLDRLENSTWQSLQLSSSYDFDANMTVFVPGNIPAPNETGYSDALEQLLLEVHTTMGGSTLTLFTNRREMERHFELLDEKLKDRGLKLLCQSRGTSAKRLRDEFLADETLSLFALKSFWEGFDAPGETLRCVVIPRLPFSRPNDPLSLERERRDSNAWGHYTLPEAVISLKQAAGRLIRTSTDKGILVLGDSRLVTRRYGKTFLKALPSNNIHIVQLEDLARDMERSRDL